MDQRKGLRGGRDDDHESWTKAYDDYLAKLKCPSEDLYKSKKMQFLWLLGHAVKVTYMQEGKRWLPQSLHCVTCKNIRKKAILLDI